MDDRVYLYELSCWETATKGQLQYVANNAYYDLRHIPSAGMRKELRDFILNRGEKCTITTMYSECNRFNRIAPFFGRYGEGIESFCDRSKEEWIRLLKKWMLSEGISLVYNYNSFYGTKTRSQSRLLTCFENILNYILPEEIIDERLKDIWRLEKLDIPFRENLIKNVKTLNFTEISQEKIREELKRGIYLNLQNEAISCVQKEIRAMRRLSRFLQEQQPRVLSLQDVDRKIVEEYLIHLNVEVSQKQQFHSELTRLRAIIESIGNACGYEHLRGLFLQRDIPRTSRTLFKTYSDAELKRLNKGIVEMDEQIARLLIIHQMLGTRISDTLTLRPDCLFEKNGQAMIRIHQMKSKMFEKPISEGLEALIRAAIEYGFYKYGETPYIFVDERNHDRPMQYSTLQVKLVSMIKAKDLRDDSGQLFGGKTHIFRHYYGMKLTEMHLDDWTIARLLGHSSVRNVKYYRQMSNQLLAEETWDARQMLSETILANLDGWEGEYVQVRKNACRKQTIK